jgi:hypothetical protein
MFAFWVLVFFTFTNLVAAIKSNDGIQVILNIIFSIIFAASAYQVWTLAQQ